MNPLKIIDEIPDPWNPRFLSVLVIAAVIAAAVLGLRSGELDIINALLTLAAVICVLWAAKPPVARPASSLGNARRPIIMSVILQVLALCFSGIALSRIAAGWLEYAAVLLPQLLVGLLIACSRVRASLEAIFLPLLLGLAVFGTAALMGQTAIGGYPSVLALLLSTIVIVTRAIERKIQTEHSENRVQSLHTRYHGLLNIVSTVLFLFGVVTLWPWLGEDYGNVYLWILIVGVLAPMLYVWGRLRQPRDDNPLLALSRFNRLVPYLAFVLLLAIVVG